MTHGNSAPGASNAFAWSLLNTMVSKVGTLGIGIVLARMLGPDSFGTYAVALVALMAVLSFNELGVSLAIVRWPGDPAKIVPTVNSISVAGSGLFCAGAVLAAPAFAAAMGDPEATDVVRVLILSVFINGVVASPAALLQRDFKEKTRLGIDQVNVWTGAVLSIVLALAGMGAMALAVGRVAGSLVSAAMFLASSPMPYRFGLDRNQLGPLLRFGLPLAGTSIIFFAVGYADQLTAGALLGPAALAFYVLAFNLANWPVSILAQPLRRVAPAAFSALQQDKAAMNSALVSVVAVLAAATLPPVMFLAGSAVPLVDLVYGKEWLPAAAALSWLVVGAVSRIFSDLAYDFMVVLGRSGTVFAIQAGSLVVLVPALAAGAALGGLQGLAFAQALVCGCILLPLCLWQLANAGISVRAVSSVVWVPALASLAVGALSLGLVSWLPVPWLELPAGALLAASTAAALLYWRRDDVKLLKEVGREARSEVGELVP
ncbi:oligosaccharide flippase family protein [Arthrobacter sp. Y81]|uniref:oligosaccharide flippase family protein n=1 Tax=Arthrobacter sp. Y81 TaxID=2058897 RepID=UPI000CE4618E|nr:oligosaccharide flippase family protein [Arthrobacter sp. Y81]